MKHINLFLLLAIIVSACASRNIDTPEATSTTPSVTSTPLSTNTPEPSPTATPTPLGGGDLLVAFYAFGDCGSCLIVGNFFTGEVLVEIPVNTSFKNENFPRGGQIYWSPDGESILYTDTTPERMNVFLLNLETKQPKKLGDFPAKGTQFWNRLSDVRWSYDSQYIRYKPDFQDDKVSKAYIASNSGVISIFDSYIGLYWFPDSKTLFSPYGKEIYNIDTEKTELAYTDVINKFKFSFISEEFIFIEREKTKITVIPFPENWEDPSSWQYDNLYSQIFTIAELSPEIKNGEVYSTLIQEIDDEHIAILGYVDTSNSFSYFYKLIDLKNLPVIINTSDFVQQTGDIPVIVSPDANYYLMGYCTFVELCQNFTPNWQNLISHGWEFKILNSDSIQQQLASDLSQFNGVTKINANVIDRGYGNLLENIAFYWKK